MNDICFSGGADGADTAWGKAAKRAGHGLRHMTFAGHKGSRDADAFILDKDELESADETMSAVNERVLHRSFPCHSTFVTNLVRRNYFQVVNTTSVYVVAGIDGNTVFGGTAWAVEAFKMLNPDSEEVYVFDQDQKQWFQWKGMGWSKIDKPPRPTGWWTGIGSRVLNEAGQEAVDGVFEDADREA